MRYPNLKMLVIDSGLFVSFAERMARDFGTVWFGSTPDDPFPTSAPLMIGQGLENVYRIGAKDPMESVFDYIEEADIIAFPDVYRSGLQDYLRRQGKRVWGAGKAAKFELMRWFALKEMHKLGMSVPPTDRVIGMEKLRKTLSESQDKYVKVSFHRGDFESFHYTDPDLFKEILDDLESRLGPKAKSMEFLVQEPTDEAVEIGYDGWTVDGQFPSIAGYGYEIKDKAYCGVIKPYSEFPKFLREVNSRLSEMFKSMGFRGQYSNEVRYEKDHSAFLTDPTCRMPSPPGEAMLEAYENFPEIVFEAAGGNLVTPKPVAKYVALAEIHSRYAAKNWMAVKIPEQNQQFIKFKNIAFDEDRGVHIIVPNFGDLIELGAVIGFGKTLQEAIGQVKKHAEGLDGYDLSIKVEALDDAQDVIKKGEQFGVKL